MTWQALSVRPYNQASFDYDALLAQVAKLTWTDAVIT
jgi:hypothetical protein